MTKQEKARGLRYKKPIVKDLNLEEITRKLWEIYDACGEVEELFYDDTLVDTLDGDEEEATEFKLTFSDLQADIEQMINDLDETWVPDCFDKFFAAAGSEDLNDYLGYDSYESDYYGLEGYESQWARESATKSLMSLTKKELIDAARQCLRIYQSYIGLSYRYDCLEAAMAVLREKNIGVIKMIKQIEETYTKAEADSEGFKYTWIDSVKELNRLIDNVPPEVWLN